MQRRTCVGKTISQTANRAQRNLCRLEETVSIIRKYTLRKTVCSLIDELILDLCAVCYHMITDPFLNNFLEKDDKIMTQVVATSFM